MAKWHYAYRLATVFTIGEMLKLCVVVEVFETAEIVMIGKKFGHTCIFTLLRSPL